MIEEIVDRLEHIPPKLLKSLLGGVLWEGTPKSPGMALTFDDGPDPDVTPAVLDILAEHEVRATFFLQGSKAEAHPALVRRIHDSGHLLGNHSWSHRKLFLAPESEVEEEIGATQSVLTDITGTTPRWFRPPHGLFDFTCTRVAARHSLTPVLWSVLAGDYGDDAGTVIERVRPFIRHGAVVVFHDTLTGGGTELPDMLETVIDEAGERDVPLCGVDDLVPPNELLLEEAS